MTSKELARRLRFDRFPASDAIRRRRRWAAGAATAALLAWGSMRLGGPEEPYLPGPVTASHALFGDDCATCHEPWAGVPSSKCEECHAIGVHSEMELHTPDCIACHLEHRPESPILRVADASCVACHGNLETERPEAILAVHVESFATHPELAPRRAGVVDETALRFNHRAHLTSDKIPDDDRLTCESCHVPDAASALMLPVRFEDHCRRCHAQEIQGPLGAIEVPHERPEIVREALAGALLEAAVRSPTSIFEGRRSTLPGVRDRPPIDASRSLGEYQRTQLERLEKELFAPHVATGEGASLLDENTLCFLCHVEGERAGLGALPAIRDPEPPARWLDRADFSHEPHGLVDCAHCHGPVEESVLTSDVNLPGRAVCEECHAGDGTMSAGTDCRLCHRYHRGESKVLERAMRASPRRGDATTEKSGTEIGDGPI